MVSQLVTGEIMIGVPHRAKFRSGIKCMGKELSGTLRKDKRKLLEIGEWFEASFLHIQISNLKISFRFHKIDVFLLIRTNLLSSAQIMRARVNHFN
jgi:hypothetical protein